MKKSIITIVAFMLFALAGFAQGDKAYLNGIVRIYTTGATTSGIYVSLEGQPYKFEKASKECKDVYDYTCALQYISQLQNEGWEITSTQVDEQVIYYFLRKKKQ